MAIEVSKEKFKSTVGLGMQYADTRIREVVTELSQNNKQQKQSKDVAQKKLNQQILQNIATKEL